MEKELWTIDDIIKDYEDKGLAGRSKIEFLESVKKILDGRLITTISVPLYKNKEEYEELLQTIKDQLKEKLYIPLDYSNPGPIINEIYLSKRYLKWEDLEFKNFKRYYFKVKLGDAVFEAFTCFDRGFNQNMVVIETDTPMIIIKDSKQLFNDLHFEAVEE